MFQRIVSFGSELVLVGRDDCDLAGGLFFLFELDEVGLAEDVTGPDPMRHRISIALGTSPFVDWRTCKFLVWSVKPMARRAEIWVV